LMEEFGQRKLPIVIGTAEAQAIALALEGMNPPRPLTHDLFVNFALAYSINLVEVLITKLEGEIFYAELVCENISSRIKIDSRTSDAVALAIRFKCPIYANESVLKAAGISYSAQATQSKSEINLQEVETSNLSAKSLSDLENLLHEAINNENYELASKIRDEINKRK
jgi:uncharacterized protein